MMEYESVILDNDKQYVIVDKISVNDNNYLILSNPDDENDFCIKKVVIKDTEELILPLDSEDEFNTVLLEYSRKNI